MYFTTLHAPALRMPICTCARTFFIQHMRMFMCNTCVMCVCSAYTHMRSSTQSVCFLLSKDLHLHFYTCISTQICSYNFTCICEMITL
jgi:hypothetical protein